MSHVSNLEWMAVDVAVDVPGVSGTRQGRMSDSKQRKPDFSGTGETEKMQVAIGFPESAVLDESFS